MNEEIKYFLRHIDTNLPATFDIESNEGGEFCVSNKYTLSPSNGDPVWYVDTKVIAENARVTHTGWYNAGKETPSHSGSFNPEEYEVVKRVFTYTDELA